MFAAKQKIYPPPCKITAEKKNLKGQDFILRSYLIFNKFLQNVPFKMHKNIWKLVRIQLNLKYKIFWILSEWKIYIWSVQPWNTRSSSIKTLSIVWGHESSLGLFYPMKPKSITHSPVLLSILLLSLWTVLLLDLGLRSQSSCSL